MVSYGHLKGSVKWVAIADAVTVTLCMDQDLWTAVKKCMCVHVSTSPVQFVCIGFQPAVHIHTSK